MSKTDPTTDQPLSAREKKRIRDRRYYASHIEEKRRYARDYRLKHIEQKTEYLHKYQAEHKEQARENNKRYRAEHKDKLREYHRKYRLEHLERIRENGRRYRTEHREEHRAEGRRFYARHHDEMRTHQREYLKRHPECARAYVTRRRARKLAAGGNFKASDVRRQLRSQKGRCYWCNAKLNGEHHIDHVIPLSRGGSNGPDNIVIACPICNLSKGDKLPHEWNGNGGKLL